MALDRLTIHGLRGFAEPETITFARPNGSSGSGLTMTVGANNTGKTTVIEALRALIQPEPPNIPVGRRNTDAGDQIRLRLTTATNPEITLQSVQPWSSATTKHPNTDELIHKVVVLPSRRTFSPFFTERTPSMDRHRYMEQVGFPSIRTAQLDAYSLRLFEALRRQREFNELLGKVINPVPEWGIDQQDTGQYFLKFRTNSGHHSSEGLGEGLISLFFIIDALYDSREGDTIVIDEPELSLHPALQRKLARLFADYARTRQIVLSTHSPYFVDLEALINGGSLARCFVQAGRTQIRQLSAEGKAELLKLTRDLNNPHVFGLNAQEVFFLEDHIILLEGQEDVIFYDKILDMLGITLEGNFYGWGVGGADKMPIITKMLSDLGYTRVVGILDGNKQAVKAQLSSSFPSYRFECIPTDDVRSKGATKSRDAVLGLLSDDNSCVRPEYRTVVENLFQTVNEYLSD